MDNKVSVKEKLDVIGEFIPGTASDIAMMIPCHVNTLRNIKSGDGDVRITVLEKIDKIYKKALKIK